MTSTDPLQSRYDETPYPDQAFVEFDLARLLGLAQLFGVSTAGAEPRELRVLDLACASGLHVRTQGALYPEVRFTGIDFSSEEIEAGRKAIDEAHLDNVELIHADLREVEIDAGAFDVVICHGAFSWVPDDVKDRILQLCRFGLKPTGVAAIAYLTYPGWKQKEALRELLAMRVANIEAPEERLRESALVLRFLHAGYSANDDNCHASSLKAVVETMQKSSKKVFLHDELGHENDPCYFMQFAEWADECGLRYLAESDLGSMSVGGLPTSAGGLLDQLAPNFLETQQLLDFVINRSGRSSMLVRSDAVFDRKVDPENLASLDFTTRWWDVTPLNSKPGAARSFESHNGARLSIENPALERVLKKLTKAVPEPVPAADLYASEASEGQAEEATTAVLLELLGRGAAEPLARIG
jgi:SAM-dependent methyltransferase